MKRKSDFHEIVFYIITKQLLSFGNFFLAKAAPHKTMIKKDPFLVKMVFHKHNQNK